MDENRHPNGLPDAHGNDRRRFLEFGFWLSTGTAAGILGVAGARFWLGDALTPSRTQWVDVGTIEEIPIGKIHTAIYSARSVDAWRDTPRTGVLYAYSDDRVVFVVLDATCTHLGCNVRWDEEGGYFLCPCHHAKFSRLGEVVNGPTSIPLRRLQTKIENGVLKAMI